MCECTKNGYTTWIGMEKFNCNCVPNKNCEECIKLAKERFDEIIDKFSKTQD